MVENGWFKINLQLFSLVCCLEQAEEISGLCPGFKLIRAEAGRVEAVGVSDSYDVVEEAKEEETDEWCQVEEEGVSGDAERNSPGEDPSKLTGLDSGADGDAAELGHCADVLSCENQREHV